MTLHLFSNGTQKNVKSLTLERVYELCGQQAPELIGVKWVNLLSVVFNKTELCLFHQGYAC